MLQLRGNEQDCAITPNDPVCQAIYGTTPPPAAKTGLIYNPLLQFHAMTTGGAPATTAIAPGTTATTTTPVTTPWFKTWPGIIGIAAVGLLAYKVLGKPAPKASSAPSAAVAGLRGLFGIRHRRRARR